MNLDDICRIREDEVYPKLFGAEGRGLFPLSAEQFECLGVNDIDERWLLAGVMEFPPTPMRKSWLYVTSGHSNPLDVAPEDYSADDESGSGIEFTLETPTRGDWAITRLQDVLALDIALTAGLDPERDPLSIEEILSLDEGVDGSTSSRIRHLIVAQGLRGPHEFTLPSGRVHLLNLVGITDSEMNFANLQGADILLQRLAEAGWREVTDPGRMPVT